MSWNKDNWGIIINGDGTYEEIHGRCWRCREAIAFNWTPQNGSVHVLLLTPAPEGPDPHWAHSFHPALAARQMLFVSVIRKGVFGFDVGDEGWLSPDYVGEKLDLQGNDAIAMAELLNGAKSKILGKPIRSPVDEPKETKPAPEAPEEEERDREGLAELKVSPPHYGVEDDSQTD